MSSRPPAFVRYIDLSARFVKVSHGPGPGWTALRRLGGRRRFGLWGVWRFTRQSEPELATLLGQLRDIGIPFGGAPHGWPPAEVFAHLRDRGLLAGSFNEIVWRGPGRFLVRVYDEANWQAPPSTTA